MSLTKCKECGAAVSTNATACPGCGAKQGDGSSGCLLTTAIVAVVFIVVMAASGGGGSSSSRSSSLSSGEALPQNNAPVTHADHTPAYMQVCLDTGERGISDYDPRIARYQNAIDTIAKRFKISETMIGDQTWVTVDTLRKHGIKTSGIEIMEGVVSLKEADTLGVSYAEILASVATIMLSKSAK